MTRPAPNDETAVRVTPPGKRRTRGPNKPKPGAIEVRTEAVMNQAEIVKLLEAHAVAMLGAAGAEGMTLQVNIGNGWSAPAEIPPHGVIIRFATAKGSGT
jgi:hypothetical protein